jgi:hypothetical protein
LFQRNIVARAGAIARRRSFLFQDAEVIAPRQAYLSIWTFLLQSARACAPGTLVEHECESATRRVETIGRARSVRASVYHHGPCNRNGGHESRVDAEAVKVCGADVLHDGGREYIRGGFSCGSLEACSGPNAIAAEHALSIVLLALVRLLTLRFP